jgi:hypothetical protein
MSPNPRRVYDRDGREIEPMSLAIMREHGVQSVAATCEAPIVDNDSEMFVQRIDKSSMSHPFMIQSFVTVRRKVVPCLSVNLTNGSRGFDDTVTPASSI